MKMKPLTVGLRDDMDAYYAEHQTVPSRAWVLSRILIDDDGHRMYSEAEVRELPLADVEQYWTACEETLTAPTTSAPVTASAAG